MNPMKQISIMIKPASSLCNLRCKYCFYANVADLREVRSYGFMSEETVDRLLENVYGDLKPGDRISFAFQGGEPTMAGLDYFQTFTEKTARWQGISVSYALQTNGTLLDDKWCAFLKQRRFLVGISWDVLPEYHDSARVDGSGRGTNRAVLNAIALLEKWGVEYNVLCTLTNFAAKHPQQVWKQLIKHNIRFVQFTPCLDELDLPGKSQYALTPERFASFYDQIFRLWYLDFCHGRYRSVKLIDDIVNLIVYGAPTACGINGRCSLQIVVEADGSVYPCDFYCIDAYRLGNLTQNHLTEILESPKMAAFANRSHVPPKLCQSCEFAHFCGGNCKRMQRQICCAPDGDFCGYQDFLRHHQKALTEIAETQKSWRPVSNPYGHF